MVIQGRETSTSDIHVIKELVTAHPHWHRTRISRELCRLWNWRNTNGQLKDMACRTFLLKLERAGHIILPKRRREAANHSRGKSVVAVEHSTEAISCNLKSLAAIKISLVDPRSERHCLFNYFLSSYHYLGYKTPVGENMKYMILDRFGRPLSCVLFGSAAWKTAPRDEFIGWSHQLREKNVNN
ncbi:MAG: DUF4338 domain-containing protein, partial [Candidatus Omnitrophica bacterium]|nr:DUF4338 domain-containing protein [Candidatus Omnitrophota bacterium]